VITRGYGVVTLSRRLRLADPFSVVARRPAEKARFSLITHPFHSNQ
jgi:hypothetical protein